MTKCADTEHDFEKFTESTVVCRKCADQRTVATLEAVMEQLRAIHICPTYIPCTLPHFPYQPYWGTTWTAPNTSTTITYTGSTTDSLT